MHACMWWQRMTKVVLCSKERVICEFCKHLWVVLHTCKVNVGWELWSVLNCWFSTMGRVNSSRRSIGGRSQNCWSNISDMQNIHSTNESKDYLLPTSARKITLPNFWLNAPSSSLVESEEMQTNTTIYSQTLLRIHAIGSHQRLVRIVSPCFLIWMCRASFTIAPLPTIGTAPSSLASGSGGACISPLSYCPGVQLRHNVFSGCQHLIT